jgi:hypothetical protein
MWVPPVRFVVSSCFFIVVSGTYCMTLGILMGVPS